MGLLTILFPPPATLPELVRRHDLPALERVVKKESRDVEGGAGAFLNRALDGDGNTPLILAASCGAYRIVDWIVAQPGVELDARNRFGWTALYEAAGTGNRHVLERLVQAGANPKLPATAWPRQTPRQMANQMGFHACVEVLQTAERAWHEKRHEAKRSARRLLHEQHKQERAAAAAAAAAAGGKGAEEEGEEAKEERAVEEGTEAPQSPPPSPAAQQEAASANGKGASVPSPSPPPHQASEGGVGKEEALVVDSEAPAPEDEDEDEEDEAADLEKGDSGSPTAAAAAAVAGATALPACLRWQVEEGVGEWHAHRMAWDEDDFLLEVHPVAFRKRGPRVGRHRRRSRSATLLDKIFCCAGSNRGLRAPFHHNAVGAGAKGAVGVRRKKRWLQTAPTA